MNRDPCAYSIYAYVFDDGHTYIGLTKCPSRRASNHRSPDSNSAVQRYWKTSGQDVFPEMLVLYNGLSASEAQRTEGLLVDCISQCMRLNVAPTGIGVSGLGGRLERTDEEIREAKRLQRRKAVERMTKWVSAHQEARKAYMKEYRRKNRSSLAERNKKYHIRFRKERLLQMAEYARTRKDKKREYDKNYRQLHREKRNEQTKAWRKEHQERLAEYARTHKDEIREYNRIYRQLHREKLKEQMKTWRKRQKSGTTTKSGR